MAVRKVKKHARTGKLVYFFGGGKADGNAEMKNLLGGKGANLAEMTSLGIPVPAGFTITTEVCTAVLRERPAYPEGAQGRGRRGDAGVEEVMGTSSATRGTRCSSRCAPAPAARCRA